MKPKVWITEYAGHVIRVTNEITLLPPGTVERLEVDGVLVAQGGLLMAHFATLNAVVELDGRPRHLEARLGNRVGGLSTACHVLIDGERVGGDVDLEVDHPSADQAREAYAEGFAGLLLGGRLLAAGIPFAAVMVLFQRPDTALSALAQFALLTFGFGGAMCWAYWRSLCRQVEGYERCSADQVLTDETSPQP